MQKAAPFVILVAALAVVGLVQYMAPAPSAAAATGVQAPEATAAGGAVDQAPDATQAFEPVPFPLPPASCGGNVCGPGEYCCNPSCGTCVRFGNYCTQQVCSPTS